MNEWEWNLLEDKAATVSHVEIDGIAVKIGDRVRLRPKEGGDILDIALRGQIAIIESIEEDYEGAQHICVVIEDDPGRDLGMMRQPGHRFFFTPGGNGTPPAVTATAAEANGRKAVKPTILVAGIGNIFLGDDAFGVEVVRRLHERAICPRKCASSTSAFAASIWLMPCRMATRPPSSSMHFLTDKRPEPSPSSNRMHSEIAAAPDSLVEAHSMHPLNVLRMAAAMNGSLNRVLLVGCEPASLGGDEGYMGLSEPVEAAVEEAVNATEALVRRLLAGEAV